MPKPFMAGSTMTSEEWVTLGDFLYRLGDSTDLEKAFKRADKNKPYLFLCDGCQSKFESLFTPEVCPLCGAAPGASSIELTHKTVTKKTFAFAVGK